MPLGVVVSTVEDSVSQRQVLQSIYVFIICTNLVLGRYELDKERFGYISTQLENVGLHKLPS